MAQVQIALATINNTSLAPRQTKYYPTQYFNIPANAGINSAVLTYVTQQESGTFADRGVSLNATRAHSGWINSGTALNVALLAAGQNTIRFQFSAGQTNYAFWGISSVVLTIDYTPPGSPNPVLPKVYGLRLDESTVEIYRDANADVFFDWGATQGSGGGIYRYDGGYRDDGVTDVWNIGVTTNYVMVKAPPAGVSRQFFIYAKADGGDSLVAASPFVHSYSAVKAPTTVTVTPSTVYPGASVNISWGGAQNGKGVEIIKYQIYRNDVYLGETTGTTFTTTALGVGSYAYKVYVIGNRTDYNSGASPAATLTVAYPPSTAKINKSTVPMDDSSTIMTTVTAGLTSYTHEVSWYPNNGWSARTTQTIAAGVKTATLTVPMSWIGYYPSTSGTANVRIISKTGSTTVNTVDLTFLVTVPTSVKPTVSLAVAPVSGFNGLYLKGISKVKLTNTAVGIHGSTIKAHSMYGGGYSGSTNPWTSGILGVVGSNVMTTTVTDTRNRQATAQQTITVLNYNNPVISSVSGIRCNDSGEPDNIGLYAKVKANLSITAIAGNNITVAKVEYKKSSDAGWVLGDSAISSGVYKIIGGSLAIDATYDLRITLKDTVGKETVNTYQSVIPAATAAWDFRNDRASLGRIAGEAKTLMLPDDWTTNLNADKLDGKHASAFAASSHSHITLYGSTDNRTVATQPNDYNASFTVAGLKQIAKVGNPMSGSYVGIIGFRQWTDSSGGDATEMAFGADGISFRQGATTAWGAWRRLIDSGNFVNYVYPVGAIYMSLTATSPATLFGGTWAAIAAGRFLVAAGSGYGVGATGGAATHTHTTPNHAHTTPAMTLTVAQIPSHEHAFSTYGAGQGGPTPAWTFNDGGPINTVTSRAGGGGSHAHGNTGNAAPTTNSASSLPPYYAVYMWRRTA